MAQEPEEFDCLEKLIELAEAGQPPALIAVLTDFETRLEALEDVERDRRNGTR